MDLVRADPNLQLFQFEMIIASRRQPQLRPTVERLYDRYIDSFQTMLSLFGYPDRRPLARAIFASMESLSLQQLTVVSPEEVKAAIADLDELLALHADSPARTGPQTTVSCYFVVRGSTLRRGQVHLAPRIHGA